MDNLGDALKMVAASFGLHVFNDESDTNVGELVNSLKSLEILSCEDFRLAFVIDDVIDDAAIDEFSIGKLVIFRDVVHALACDLIPQGGFVAKDDHPPPLKRARPTLNVGGRLVYRSLDQYQPQAVLSTSKKPVPYAPSAAAIRHRETAIRSVAKMEQKLALGHVDDTTGHCGVHGTIHKREEDRRAKAIDVGLMVL